MISSFEKNSMRDLLKDFYAIVGIRISIFDDEGNAVTEYPDEAPDICKLIRRTDEGARACRDCDADAFKRAKKLREPHVYTCHAGITEAITPIQLGGGVIGYAIFAHMMSEENYENAVAEVCRRCEKYGDPEEIGTAVKKIKKQSKERILACVKMLDAIAAYLQISKLASWKNEDISRQIDSFIDANIKEELSSDVICKHFFISRTKLYQIAMQSFGMGISQYVSYKRIEKAKELMLDDSLTIAHVAREVGIDDYNYFCKMFRKSIGVPPGKYRNTVN